MTSSENCQRYALLSVDDPDISLMVHSRSVEACSSVKKQGSSVYSWPRVRSVRHKHVYLLWHFAVLGAYSDLRRSRGDKTNTGGCN